MSEDKVLKKLSKIEQKLVGHDKRFDNHDKRFAGHDKKFIEHDKKFDRLIMKSLEHDDEFKLVRQEIKGSEGRILSAIDGIAGRFSIFEAESAATTSILDRHEEEIGKVKKVLKMS